MKILLKCKKARVIVCPEYLRGVANFMADALSRGRKAKEWSLEESSPATGFEALENSSNRIICKWVGIQVAQYFQHGPLGWEEMWGDGLKVE